MEIKLNGETVTVTPHRGSKPGAPMTISFETLAEIAGLDGRLPTVTYATAGDRSGMLAPGQRTRLTEGMAFNVCVTDGA